MRLMPALVGWVLAAAAATGWAADRPNILWISAEDLSAGTLGCYGGAAHTPRLDGLAAAGLPEAVVQVIETPDRAAVGELLRHFEV